MITDWDQFQNFSEVEFRCQGNSCCGNVADMDLEFMISLQALRSVFRKPIVITSGYRCPDHNVAVSTTGRGGPHTTGKAVDIKINGADADELIKLSYQPPFTGHGIKQHGQWNGRFIHLDTLVIPKRPRTWTYP